MRSYQNLAVASMPWIRHCCNGNGSGGVATTGGAEVVVEVAVVLATVGVEAVEGAVVLLEEEGVADLTVDGRMVIGGGIGIV